MHSNKDVNYYNRSEVLIWQTINHVIIFNNMSNGISSE